MKIHHNNRVVGATRRIRITGENYRMIITTHTFNSWRLAKRVDYFIVEIPKIQIVVRKIRH